MQSEADISRALESHERALFDRSPYGDDAGVCESCGEESRECDCSDKDDGPPWDLEDVDDDREPYYGD